MNKLRASLQPDALLTTIADYVHDYEITNELSLKTAEIALLDSLASAMYALSVSASHLLGPYVAGTKVPLGARVPGTRFELDPIKAAFDIGLLIRWLDYNDTWLAKEWAHPSDNLGCILGLMDYLSRGGEGFSVSHASHVSDSSKKSQNNTFTMQTLLQTQIKAYEIQGILALENAFNRVGLDHVILVKVASSALASKLMGQSKEETIAVLSHAWIDGHSLRTYRHAPNTGPRKSWAAADATSRGLWLAWAVLRGQIGIPKAITAPNFGFSAALFRDQPIILPRPFTTQVMENILFKVSYPAEFHAQTALEAAIKLHAELLNRDPDIFKSLDSIVSKIKKIKIETQEAGKRIIDKTGPLHNYADRDHCIQYIVAIGLLFGDLKPEHYGDDFAGDPRIDVLREKMIVEENPEYSKAYLDPDKRAIPNAVQVFFKDGSQSERYEVFYPLGHRQRRKEAEPLLRLKYITAVEAVFSGEQAQKLIALWDNRAWLAWPVHEFMDIWMK